MRVSVKPLTNFHDMAANAVFTQGISIRDENPNVSFFKKMIISEHSPLRSLLLQIDVYNIPYYVHVHFVRHHVGVQPFVRSQRPDSMNPVDYDRTKAPQDALVDMRLVLNAQALLNIMKKRLCQKADRATRNVANTIRVVMSNYPSAIVRLLADACRPACEWQGNLCHEVFKPCGKYPTFSFWKEKECITK